jgi:hypothetical protein
LDVYQDAFDKGTLVAQAIEQSLRALQRPSTVGRCQHVDEELVHVLGQPNVARRDTAGATTSALS